MTPRPFDKAQGRQAQGRPHRKDDPRSKSCSLETWFVNKPLAKTLFDHLVREFKRIGSVSVRPVKTMIVITTARKGIAYAVPGKTFLHVVLPFRLPYLDNLCFQKVSRVQGQKQFNHHMRLLSKEDLNEEVKRFLKLAYEEGI